jgi:CheY-like chemotaxis protein
MAKRRIILCVDDDPDDQMLIIETLRVLDPSFLVCSALNGVEGLRFLRDSPTNELPALVIMDINMPLMDGKEALRQIKMEKKLEDIPVVMFTTSSSSQDRQFCEEFNVPFMTKPISSEDLFHIVKKIISYSSNPAA